MKTLILIAVLAVAVQAQTLVDASGIRWTFIGVGKDAGTGAKFQIYARRIKNPKYPALAVRVQHSSRESRTYDAEYDCKRGVVRHSDTNGGEWSKPAPKSMGAQLMKFACRK